MANAQTWRIKKLTMSKFEEFLRNSSAGHLAVGLIRGDCVYLKTNIGGQRWSWEHS